MLQGGSISVSYRDVAPPDEDIRLLAESEDRYRLLAENSTDILCHVRDGKVVWVSPSVEEALGAPPEYWLGWEVFAHIPPEDLQYQAALMARALAGETVRGRGRVVGADGVVHWLDLHARPFHGADGRQDGVAATLRLVDDEVAAQQHVEEARRRLEEVRVQQVAADALERGVIDNSVVATAMSDLAGRFVRVNTAMCDLVGYDADTLGQMTWQDITAPEFLDADLAALADMISGRAGVYRARKQYLHADGHRLWVDATSSVLNAPEGESRGFVTQVIDMTAQAEAAHSIRVVDDEVAAERAVEQARRERARADARFRRSMDSAAIGMCLLAPDGRFEEVNAALCELFGFDAETLTQKTWQDLTAPEFLADELRNISDILSGRIDSYQMVKQCIHADGHRIWGDLSVGCVRDEDGQVENFISQIIDITARVQADERNRVLAQQLQRQNDQTTAELGSAASYMKSIMPRGLAGPVTVSSRYLPSSVLGGDCFEYTWIDGDHLVAYLIDVSGHGIEPALLSVSLHNLLRSGTITAETMLDPAAVLTELNRLFQMEQQRDHFFTIWYGVYDRPTRTLRYASAGAPPAIVLHPEIESRITTTELTTGGQPVGLFEDTRFTTASYSVPPGSRILLFSDGANEIVLAGGEQMTIGGLTDVVTRLAGSPVWTLDDLIDELCDLAPSGGFEDDCSLVLITFE